MNKGKEVGSPINSGLQMKGNSSLPPSQEELQIQLIKFRTMIGPSFGGGQEHVNVKKLMQGVPGSLSRKKMRLLISKS